MGIGLEIIVLKANLRESLDKKCFYESLTYQAFCNFVAFPLKNKIGYLN
jgi:hypothetical protein